MANLAFAQAAASLAPAITQLAAENLRQQQQQQQLQQQLQQRLKDSSTAEAIQEYTRQLQQSFEQQPTTHAPVSNLPVSSVEKKTQADASPTQTQSADEYTKQLKQSFEKAAAVTETSSATIIPSRGQASAGTTAVSSASVRASPEENQKISTVANKNSSQKPKQVTASNQSKKTNQTLEAAGLQPTNGAAQAKQNVASRQNQKAGTKPPQRRSEEDKQAGAVLIGFLSSLRTSYEEALKEKEKGAKTTTATVTTLVGRPAPVTAEAFGGQSGTGSESASARQVTDNSGKESSVEDSDWSSNKKADPSSSEDSDKEQQQKKQQTKRPWGTKGPPRKRLKTQRTSSMGSSHRKAS
mmetsp:Transcript_23324/g.53522  ORF Transcript_23324/g.53522 Transcript_23324/m.53522 type:complete len:354 (+) Transcript_23324:93-1154(+)